MRSRQHKSVLYNTLILTRLIFVKGSQAIELNVFYKSDGDT